MKKLKGYVAPIIIFALLLSTFALLPSAGRGDYTLKHFRSYEEMKEFMEAHSRMPIFRVYYDVENAGMAEGASMKSSADFSRTNVQVEGVDEPDIVKTDGEFIYFLSDNVVYIIHAYPPENTSVLSKIKLDGDAENIFVRDNKLIVFCSLYRKAGNYSYTPTTLIKIYDIGNKSHPIQWKEMEMDGNYFDARMIDEHIYVIAVEDAYYILPVYINGTLNPPQLRVDNNTEKFPPSSIYYVDMPYGMDGATNVVSINLENGAIDKKSFITGNTASLYVSKNNIFLACEKYGSPIIYENPQYYGESTIIYRISLENGSIYHRATGEVPGRVLNQFSMDEYSGFLRVATTTGSTWAGNSYSGIYVLSMDMNIVGKVEKIAPGERIYAARFMGEKAYLVTFRETDPFFTINLSNPYVPEVAGELKIPGYSDYLHPYDENHIIGIGKETVEAGENKNFAWYQGLKIALFNVSEFKNPIEMDKVVIGDRGTDSNSLHDHHAFLFSKEKELLAIPVSLYLIDNETKEMYNDTASIYGDFVFQGLYVYRINLKDGIVFKGRITHLENFTNCWDYSHFIKRALYIGDTLYTLSDAMIKINDMKNLKERGEISLL
ncbi:MAG: beta-propeller domain-containing protein [Thermoplasmata archaeon]|nr:beta-propeller domain-containing protein [Thermoplasmata archaeon]